MSLWMAAPRCWPASPSRPLASAASAVAEAKRKSCRRCLPDLQGTQAQGKPAFYGANLWGVHQRRRDALTRVRLRALVHQEYKPRVAR